MYRREVYERILAEQAGAESDTSESETDTTSEKNDDPAT